MGATAFDEATKAAASKRSAANVSRRTRRSAWKAWTRAPIAEGSSAEPWEPRMRSIDARCSPVRFRPESRWSSGDCGAVAVDFA
jgi:hypothetical protein